MNLRVHPTHVKFGDPLYVEVTITNRGNDVILAPPADFNLNDFSFRLYDSGTETHRTEFQGGGVSGVLDVAYEPGKAVRHYGMIFLPGLFRANDSFWNAVSRWR